MPPVASSQHSVYCALPGRDLAEVVGQRRVDERRGAGPDDHRLAEVADVEDADRLADGGVLLDHAGGVLQRHRPAAELGELGAERHVAVVQRGLRRVAAGSVGVESAMAANLPQRAGAGRQARLSCPGDRRTPSAAPAPPRPVPTPSSSGSSQTDQGACELRARARRTSPRRTAASCARCSRRSGVTGKAGEVVKVPTAGARHRAAAGARRASARTGRRRRRYAAPRAPPPAPSPTPRRSRSPCPPTRPELVARGRPRATCSAATRSRRTRQDVDEDRTERRRRSSCSSPVARRKAGRRGVRGRAGRRRRRRRAPATGSTLPPGDLHARRRSPTRSRPRPSSSPRAAARRRSRCTVLDEKQLAELGCGGILGVGGGSAAPPRLVELTYAPAGRRRRTSRWSARASPSTPAA